MLQYWRVYLKIEVVANDRHTLKHDLFMNTHKKLKMQWTPTFYFNIIGKVQCFLIVATQQHIPVTLHIPFY